jgi:uncharacterized membrane protein HdeD (DUF308 family)
MPLVFPKDEKEGAMTMNPSDIERLQSRVTASLREHWVLFLLEGIVLLLLGAAAIVIPPLATLAVAIFFGWLLLISGIAGLVTTFWARRAPGFGWSLFSAVIGIIAGAVLIGWPVGGALSLTVVLVVFFIMEGIASIMFALDHRRELSGRWGWMLMSGIVDLVLGAIIFLGLPGTAAWAIGLMVGINLIFGGAALIGMALHARP